MSQCLIYYFFVLYYTDSATTNLPHTHVLHFTTGTV
jgi:hypothetical protein